MPAPGHFHPSIHSIHFNYVIFPPPSLAHLPPSKNWPKFPSIVRKMEMTNNGNSRNGLGEGTKMCENDPLQMLAKQCDTISGDEEGGDSTKGAKGTKTMAKGGEGGKGPTMMAQKVGTQTKAKSPNKVGISQLIHSLFPHIFSIYSTNNNAFFHPRQYSQTVPFCHQIRPNWPPS